ncbi:MAG TPA: NADH-quinone oxidoreductase subunit N [Actinocrinis sp.]|uniref:NADH-quinone oxidoreductase subunit N n=1 Tax=Actinocrinis sp. TaxID=1920516 RepID=UPI002D45124B|nr:NADH-quinone oxidoreductase subunit N [Actinocrinis sp.]HZU58258.1 NADH-quinone oxidoreductase subunit N [Actinocrinis sp.]
MATSAIFGIQSIDYTTLLPVLLTAGGALAVLLADLFLSADRKQWLSWGALGVIVASLAAELALWTNRTGMPRNTFCMPGAKGGTPTSALSCSYVVDNFTLTLQTLVLAATVLVVLMAPRRFKVPFGEYHFLLLSSLTGALVLVAARDFVTITVALETLSLPAFALVGFGRRAGGEAALKFFLMSIASTAVMLFGISLVYGATGSVFFGRVSAGLSHTSALGGAQAQVAGVGAVLTLVGFGFKISAVPFHFWTPEVYAGAPIPIAAYLSVVSKAAGFAGLILTVELAFRPYLHSLGILLAVLAAVTMTVGNVIALRQRSAVRLLAWSTVAQAGYVLVPLAVSKSLQVSASVAYLVLYAVMNLGAFGVVSAAFGDSGEAELKLPSGGELAAYRGMYRQRPRAALALAFFLLCLAGLPPGVMGLFAKVAVFKAAMTGDVAWLAVVMAVNVVIALYYYLRWAAVLFDVSLFGAARLTTTAPPAATPAGTLGATPDSAAALSPTRTLPTLAPKLGVGIAFALAVVFSFWPNPALDAVSTWPWVVSSGPAAAAR